MSTQPDTKKRPLSARPHAIKYSQPTMTKQSFKKACDINQIMLRYQKTGIVDHVAKHGASYLDLDGSTYLEHMNVVANAQTMFEELPSKARTYFDHDPVKFLDYVSSGKATAETLTELGLANHRVVVSDDQPTPTPPPEKQDADET